MEKIKFGDMTEEYHEAHDKAELLGAEFLDAVQGTVFEASGEEDHTMSETVGAAVFMLVQISQKIIRHELEL